jgi:oligoribonuclease
VSLVWLDLETTGLDPNAGFILEVAVVVTDEALVPFYSRSLLVDARLDAVPMAADGEPHDGQWSGIFRQSNPTSAAAADVERMHTGNGLLTEINERRPGGIEMAQEVLLGELAQALPMADDLGPLCGNGVAHFDRAWLAVHMPELEARFSHRHLDTRSLWLAVQRWSDFGGAPADVRAHRAMPDVMDSIAFALWFRERFMTKPELLRSISSVDRESYDRAQQQWAEAVVRGDVV